MKRSQKNAIMKNILSMYPGAVLYGLLFNISMMIDSIIAGQSLGTAGITAVALGVPGYGVAAAIIYSLIHGSGLRMIWAKGHADDAGYQRAFNGGATLVGLVGFVFTVLIYIMADDIILLCGGDKVDPDVMQSAVIYLSFCSPVLFLTALGILLQEVMNVYGLQNDRAALSLINVAVNLTVSVLCVASLPEDMKLSGLGIGTSAAGLAQLLAGLILLRIRRVHLGYHPLLLQPREIAEVVKCGFPATADYFSENIVMGIQNNLILSSFPGDGLILATAEVVCNIFYFASGTIKGMAIATEPLFGVFYAELDVKNIRKVWKYGWRMGMVMSVVWAVLFYALTPLLSALCGLEFSKDISRGMLICLIFTPAMHTVYMFTLYYEGIKRLAVSIAFAVIPDSCLYILMMAFLIPVLGKDGIWLAVGGNQLIGLILLIPLVLLIGKGSGKKTDRLLLLPEEFFTEAPIMEFEISDTKAGSAADIEKLREPLNDVCSGTDKSDTLLSFAKELVSDMYQSSHSIHIRLTEDSRKAELFLRSHGSRWEIPPSLSENLKSHEYCEGITCSYVYMMNIVRITLSKHPRRNSLKQQVV